MLAYITGTVDQELLLRNEYLAAENHVLKAQIKGRLLLSDGERASLAEIAYRLGRKPLEEVALVAKPETILAGIASSSEESLMDQSLDCSGWSTPHPARNAALGDFEAEHHEFSVNPRSASGRILGHHFED